MAAEPIRPGLVLLAMTGPPEPGLPIRPGLVLLALTGEDNNEPADATADEGG